MLNVDYDLEWLTLYKYSVIEFIKRIEDTEQLTSLCKRFVPILKERTDLLTNKFGEPKEAPKELSQASGRKSRKHRKSLRHKRKY
jgi:hypothetical protein